ncbi:sugar nucleotide-binding protein [Parathalassolituus penaei]|uniref:dTDP-4-dehydrorhamnose reductase n=1 Tax=Parathalassolituus penaei TaxID=2997323 RepID=A0A9X3ECA2_9GAMM|nr:sugar nucleotide-binding protein [Parathalassolituus penaei]MCY0964466.1 sugar nucleotide-binding protein [Parathalassolituus penaei]
MPINPFHTLIIGADRPLGQYLARALAADNLHYKSYSIEGRERVAILGSGQPFFVLTPALANGSDIEDALYWIETLEEHDAPIVLVSSLAVFAPQNQARHTETSTRFADNDHARRLLALEQRVKQCRRHLILRVGQSFSVQAGDFAHALLMALRDRVELTVDDVEFFCPTPDDDIATVLLAMMKQADCSDDLWGLYHFCGVEPVNAFGFTEALLAEASQYEDLSNVRLESGAGGFRPVWQVPCGDVTHLFYTFGIKRRPWRSGLGRLLRRYYRA